MTDRTKVLAKRALIVLAFVAVLALNACTHSTPTRDNVARARKAMEPYCATTGQVPYVWREVDSDGNVSVYGRCVHPGSDIARGA